MYVETENKQVVAHLYRGEMNRMTVYRQRLDITTNWAITLESAILVIYIDKKINFYFILYPFAILFFFSLLEARRYRYFYTSAKRIQYLEVGYFGKQIFKYNDMNELEFLVNNLIDVRLLLSLKDAWVVRFYRNYIWLCYISLFIMIYKYLTIDFHTTGHLVFSIVLYIMCFTLHVGLSFCQQNTFIDL